MPKLSSSLRSRRRMARAGPIKEDNVVSLSPNNGGDNATRALVHLSQRGRVVSFDECLTMAASSPSLPLSGGFPDLTQPQEDEEEDDDEDASTREELCHFQATPPCEGMQHGLLRSRGRSQSRNLASLVSCSSSSSSSSLVSCASLQEHSTKSNVCYFSNVNNEMDKQQQDRDVHFQQQASTKDADDMEMYDYWGHFVNVIPTDVTTAGTTEHCLERLWNFDNGRISSRRGDDIATTTAATISPRSDYNNHPYALSVPLKRSCGRRKQICSTALDYRNHPYCHEELERKLLEMRV